MRSASPAPGDPRPRPRLMAAGDSISDRRYEDILDGVPVSSIMSRALITISADAKLGEAREEMEIARVHHLLVEDRGFVVAVLSDRDLMRNLSPYAGTDSAQRRDDDTLRRTVFQAASYRLLTVRQSACVQEVAALLLEHRISCLPVVDDDDQVVGIVTTRDLLRGMLECAVPPRA